MNIDHKGETTDLSAAPTENLLDRARLLIHRAQQRETFKSDIWWKYEYFLRDSLAAPKPPSPQEFDDAEGFDEWWADTDLSKSDPDYSKLRLWCKTTWRACMHAARKAYSCDREMRELLEQGVKLFDTHADDGSLGQCWIGDAKAVLSKATGEVK